MDAGEFLPDRRGILNARGGRVRDARVEIVVAGTLATLTADVRGMAGVALHGLSALPKTDPDVKLKWLPQSGLTEELQRELRGE